MSDDDGTIQSRSRFSPFGWGLGVAIMAVVLLGSNLARAQLDPSDPWPKFGRDERNTCWTPVRGPHSTPILRWWAEAGMGEQIYPGSSSGPRSGAAIATINGQRYILVPGDDVVVEPDGDVWRQAKLRVFRFHPCEAGYDPFAAAATPVTTINLGSNQLDNPHSCSQMRERVYSTPLVLPNNRVVVQLTSHIVCYDLTNIDSCTETPPTLCWRYPASGQFRSKAASPTIVRAQNNSSVESIIVYGWTGDNPQTLKLVALAPPTNCGTTVAVRWERMLLSGVPCPSASLTVQQTPAIAAIADDAAERNFVLNSSWAAYPDHDQFFGVFSDSSENPPGTHADVINDVGSVSTFWQGSIGSPSVHANGDIVIPSDDGAIYGFWNTTSPDFRLQRRAAVGMGSSSCSTVAGIFPDRHLITWLENGTLKRIRDDSTAFVDDGQFTIQNGKNWEWGAPALDGANRFYVNTVGEVSAGHGRRVLAFRNGVDQAGDIIQAWNGSAVVPPFIAVGAGYDLAQEFEAPVAVDADGTLICCNRGYVLALRPLLGDFDGDGCANNFDIDALESALLTPEEWEAIFGEPIGINLLGVGDCNNDGVFNYFDLDCYTEVAAMGRCSAGYEPPGGDSARPGDPLGDPAWAHFFERLAFLRQHFGMD